MKSQPVHQQITVSGHGRAYVVGSGSLNITIRDDPHNPAARRLVETYEQASRRRLLQSMTSAIAGRRDHSLRARVIALSGCCWSLR